MILHVIASRAVGGAEQHLIDLARTQANLGLEIAVACPVDGVLADRLKRHGIRLYDWRPGWRWSPFSRWSLKRILNQVRPELIHAHMGKSTCLAGQVAGATPLVATAHTLARNHAFKHANAVICVSRAVRDSLVRMGYPAAHAHVIHNAVDTDVFRPQDTRLETRKQLGLDETSCLLVQVGRLVPVKGHAISLEAFARIKQTNHQAHFLIVGDGPERPKLIALAQRLGIASSVTFMGHSNEVAKWLSAADIFLMPSYKEGFGLALLEAMACGAAPIASRTGGMPEVVTDDEHGLLVPVGDVEALAEAIQRLIDEPDLRRSISHRALEDAQRFDLPRQAAAVSDVYQTVLATLRIGDRRPQSSSPALSQQSGGPQ